MTKTVIICHSDGTQEVVTIEAPEIDAIELATEILQLKSQLAATDYQVIKCTEAQLAGLDMPYDIQELHTSRQALRDRINELEGSDA